MMSFATKLSRGWRNFRQAPLASLRHQLSGARYWLAGFYFTHFVRIFRQGGVRIHVPNDLTDYMFRSRFLLGNYEVEEAKWLEAYLPPDAKVLELGACLGYVSCLTNRLLNQPENHVVVEANPLLLPWIEKNRQENGAKFRIESRIISHTRKNTFYIHNLIVGGSTQRATPKSVEVLGVTFAELRESHGIDFDTLIMDIEGGELALFREHAQEIARFSRLFYEVHPHANILTPEEAEECEQHLHTLGFELQLRSGNFQIWEKRGCEN